MTENEDKNKHTTIKTEKRSNKLSLCKRKYHFTWTAEIFSRMWQPFIQKKGNYDKIIPLAFLAHNLVTQKHHELLQTTDDETNISLFYFT